MNVSLVLDKKPDPGEGNAFFGVRSLINLYHDIQKLRVAANNRIAVSEYSRCPLNHVVPLPKRKKWSGMCPICGVPADIVKVEPPAILREVRDDLHAIEKSIYRYLYGLVRDTVEWRFYLSRVKGVGPVLAAGLLCLLHPARFDTVSKMWKYAGLHVVDGRAPRRVRGQKVEWNPAARRLCWLIGRSFQMVGGAYKAFYRMFYAESLSKHPDWTKAHHIAHARRVTVKLFLAHYWETIRTLHGLPVRKPYIAEKEPHRYIPPVIDYTGDYTKDEFYQRIVLPRLEEADLKPSHYHALLETINKIKGKGG